MRWDMAIIGSGAAAFAAAIAARRNGASVLMIERDTLGGTCVNTGCVPSKALLAAVRPPTTARHPAFGLADLAELIAAKDDLVTQLRSTKYADVAVAHGWEILTGDARLASGDNGPVIEVTRNAGTTRIEAEHVLIATGAKPWIPKIPGLRGLDYLTSASAMAMEAPPSSLLIVGGSAVGLEMGQFFTRLGTRVTIVEALAQLASGEEPEAAAALAIALEREGLRVATKAAAVAMRRSGAGVSVTLDGENGRWHARAERVLVACGRRPDTAGLGLDRVGVKRGERGEVLVDDRLRTHNPRVWAAGDVIGGPQFVYVAASQGTAAADNALSGAARVVDQRLTPRVIFTSPAIAAVGLSSEQACRAGHRCESRIVSLAEVPRAIVERATDGIIKIVADADTGQVLGVHVVAEQAGEIVAAAGYALAAGMTVTQLADAWCPYLTWTEALKLAARSFRSDVSALSCCAS
jgi:mercuric reductase